MVSTTQSPQAPFAVNPEVFKRWPDYGVSLPWIYVIWIGVVFVLYWPCAWYAGVT